VSEEVETICVECGYSAQCVGCFLMEKDGIKPYPRVPTALGRLAEGIKATLEAHRYLSGSEKATHGYMTLPAACECGETYGTPDDALALPRHETHLAAELATNAECHPPA
jgi:hypothetical protein